MKSVFLKSGIALVLVSIALSPTASFAKSVSFGDSTNTLVSSSKWTTNGDVSIKNDIITLTEKKNEKESAYRDISVKGHGGDYLVMAAYTKAEKVRKNDITGLPVLYGYAMNANGKILAYLQGQDMIRTDAKSGEWTVNSGTFEIPKGTTTIRYFLNQAEKKGSAKLGDDASFKSVGLYVVDSKADAARVRSSYTLGVLSLR